MVHGFELNFDMLVRATGNPEASEKIPLIWKILNILLDYYVEFAENIVD